MLLPHGPEKRVLALGCCDEILYSLRRTFNRVKTSSSVAKIYDIVILDCRNINQTNLSGFDSCVNTKTIIVCLGGDHLITITILKAMKDLGLNVDVIQLDAHSDNLFEQDKFRRVIVMRCLVDRVGIDPKHKHIF